MGADLAKGRFVYDSLNMTVANVIVHTKISQAYVYSVHSYNRYICNICQNSTLGMWII